MTGRDVTASLTGQNYSAGNFLLSYAMKLLRFNFSASKSEQSVFSLFLTCSPFRAGCAQTFNLNSFSFLFSDCIVSGSCVERVPRHCERVLLYLRFSKLTEALSMCNQS